MLEQPKICHEKVKASKKKVLKKELRGFQVMLGAAGENFGLNYVKPKKRGQKINMFKKDKKVKYGQKHHKNYKCLFTFIKKNGPF